MVQLSMHQVYLLVRDTRKYVHLERKTVGRMRDLDSASIKDVHHQRSAVPGMIMDHNPDMFDEEEISPQIA